jgi:uncharacterized protein
MDRSAGLVVDAGPLFALVDRHDPDHHRCASLMGSHPGPLVVPMLAIAEVAHFAQTRLRTEAEIRFLLDLATGAFMPEPVHPADWLRMAALVERYADLPLGIVDASVVAAAERLGMTRIATLDRRHFGVVRPAHVDAFELLP